MREGKRDVIGIVIPVHDGERFLGAALDSVLRQTRADWRLVIVDDGSRDASAAIADTYAARDARVQVVRQPQGGAAAARNRGLAEIPPEVATVIFLDADDVWVDDALEVLTAFLEDHAEAPAVHAVGRSMDADGHPAEVDELERLQLERQVVGARDLEPWPTELPTVFEVLAHYDCIAFDTTLFRREALEAAGPLDTALTHFEDYDLLIRVSLLGPIPFSPRTVLWRRQHDANVSNDAAGMWRGLRQIRRKLMRVLADDPQRLRVARLGQRYAHRANRRREMSFAAACWRAGQVARGARHLVRAAVSGLKDLSLAVTAAAIA